MYISCGKKEGHKTNKLNVDKHKLTGVSRKVKEKGVVFHFKLDKSIYTDSDPIILTVSVENTTNSKVLLKPIGTHPSLLDFVVFDNSRMVSYQVSMAKNNGSKVIEIPPKSSIEWTREDLRTGFYKTSILSKGKHIVTFDGNQIEYIIE